MTSYVPELEVLDFLSGEDTALDELRALFPDDGRFRHAVWMMLKNGEVVLLDASGVAMPEWRAREVLASPDAWSAGTPYKLSLTDLGLKRL